LSTKQPNTRTQHQHIYRWLCLALAAIILLGPLPYWLTGIGQSAHELSAEIGHLPDGTLTSSPKAQARHSLMLPMRLERMLVYPLLLLSFQLSGGAPALRRWLERQIPRLLKLKPRSAFGQTAAGRQWPGVSHLRQRITGHELLLILLFIVIFNLALFLLYLPFNFYRSFIVGHQFGLSALTAAGWFGDWGKSVLIALITGSLLWTGFYGLMRFFPRRWPIPAGAALLGFSFLFTLLTPMIITPLFYQVRPLADPDLRARILTLTDRAGMKVDEVEVIDASAKTTTVNAYFTGFGDARRIVLYDTLLTGYTPDQIEVVLAHEMGHWYYRHMLWSILGLGAAGWLGLFGLQWLLQRTWRSLGLSGPADVAGLPYVLAVVAIATMLSLPAQNGISRYGEVQADRFALAVSQKPAAFVELFEQFAGQNLSLVDTSDWEKFIFYSHPPIVERIAGAKAWQEAASQ
jgi:STE24 endopeptidase